MSAFFIGYSEQDIHSNHVNENHIFFCTYLDSKIHFIELGTLEDVLYCAVKGRGKYCIVPFKSIKDIITMVVEIKLQCLIF